METTWFILSRRYGGDISAPRIEELGAALDEVYEENRPGMTQADYDEHPSAFVRYGADNGSMYVLHINRDKAATLEQWTDQDYGDELAPSLTIEDVSRDRALAMWTMLQSGQVEALCSEFILHGKT